MGNGVPKICIAICGRTVGLTASDIVTIDSLPPSLSICAISDALSLPVPPTWGASFYDCRPKRQCAGDAAFAKLLWPLLPLIMVSLPLAKSEIRRSRLGSQVLASCFLESLAQNLVLINLHAVISKKNKFSLFFGIFSSVFGFFVFFQYRRRCRFRFLKYRDIGFRLPTRL